MTTLVWILVFGLLMCLLSLIGGVALLLPEPILRRLLMPSVALAAGSLIGGALFHMLPEAADHAHGDVSVWIWVAAGFALFGVLEQFLHWHHCHRPPSEHHQPLTWLLLIADAVHNFVGGLAVGGAFLIDIRVGVVAWVAAAAHEIPQELGDFGVLLHGGWKPARALLFNALSALTFPIGGVLAWALSSGIDVSFLLPFGAGNFLYIAAADLIPEIKREATVRSNLIHSLCFAVGLGVLLAIRLAVGGHHHH